MATRSLRSRIPGLVFFVSLCVPVGAFLAAWLPYDARERLASNDRSALTALYTLRTAEVYFRETDRDGNGVKDYWTADIAGLFRFGLIERAVAEADASPLIPLVPKPVPYHGYLFRMMVQDENTTPPEVYAQETDPKSGKVHHRTKFAFCVYPAEPGVTGKYIYFTHESYSGFSCPVDGRPIPMNRPKDRDLKDWNCCLGGG